LAENRRLAKVVFENGEVFGCELSSPLSATVKLRVIDGLVSCTGGGDGLLSVPNELCCLGGGGAGAADCRRVEKGVTGGGVAAVWCLTFETGGGGGAAVRVPHDLTGLAVGCWGGCGGGV